jgi:hypothetical protein
MRPAARAGRFRTGYPSLLGRLRENDELLIPAGIPEENVGEVMTMRLVQKVLTSIAAASFALALSGCAMGGGVFGTAIADGTATTRIKTGSVGVGTSGVRAGSTDTVVTTN